MSSVIAKSFLSNVSQFLNKPNNKQHVKDIIGITTFFFGMMVVLDECLYQYKRITDKTVNQKKLAQAFGVKTQKFQPTLQERVQKFSANCSKISVISSQWASPIGVAVISKLASCFFTAAQLENRFGPNTIYALNPKHPRHLISFLAVGLALPTILIDLSQKISNLFEDKTTKEFKKIFQDLNNDKENKQIRRFITDGMIKRMALFNLITSRPVLHMANQFVSKLIKRH